MLQWLRGLVYQGRGLTSHKLFGDEFFDPIILHYIILTIKKPRKTKNSSLTQCWRLEKKDELWKQMIESKIL